MDKLTDSNLSKLQEYLQSHQEKTSLSLKIKFSANIQQNLPIIKVIEEELSQLTHLTDLSLHISKRSILTVEGYRILSNAVFNIKSLKKLSLDIDQSCFLENEGLSILQDLINQIPELNSLNLKIGTKNYITSEATQQLLDSLAVNANLTTLNLNFEEIQNSQENQGNIHFWRGLTNRNNLEELMLSFNNNNYGYSDVIELFELIASLQNLRGLSLNITNSNYETRVLDELFPQIGKIIELRSLKIDYINDNYILEDQQRETILRNLSNLRFLEYLQLNSLEQHLFKGSFGGYINLIKDLTHLKEFYLLIENSQVLNYGQIISLGKTLLALKNLNHLEFKLEQKDTNAWREFFSDLSSSFKEMHNLLSLNLEFKCEMSQKGCHILEQSLWHLLQLEKLQLSILFETEVNKSGLLHKLRKLSNLKELQLLTPYSNLNDDEEDILLDSVSQLHQLENLCLMKYEYCNFERIKNLEGLSKAFQNLRNLKELECGLCIQDLNSQNQLDLLEKCFENLSNLETLKLHLNINQKSREFQKISLTKNLTKLKILQVIFHDLTLNIFGQNLKDQRQIEYVSLTSYEKMQPQYFMEIFESLSELVSQTLFLTIQLTDSMECKEFRNACSKLKSLEKLSIMEEGEGNLIKHIDQIDQIKSLKSLNLYSYKNFLTDKDIQKANETLISLNNLQKLSVFCNIEGEAIDLLPFKQFKYYRNLNHFNFMWNKLNEDSTVYKTIEFENACYLDIQQHNVETNKMSIKDMVLHENQYNENQLKNEDNLQVFADKLSPIRINIDIAYNQEKTITLSELDFINLQYLNKLSIKFLYDYHNPVTMQLLEPMRELQSYSKLTNLILQFDNLIFNQEQISNLSKNFQFLINLQSLKLSSPNCRDDYHLLFDSLKYLVNLNSIEFQINISNNGAISLGDSLKSMTKLQVCELNILENNSTLGLAGISSIISGFKRLTNMKSLKLIMKTEQVLKDYQINLSECLQNMKYLECLHFNLEIDSIGQSCLREFITSIGSFKQLRMLDFRVQQTNIFNQEMVDELIKALNQLVFLKSYTISPIQLEDNVSIKLSEELATFFNRHPNDELTVKIAYQEVNLYQSDNICSFKSKSIEKLEISFLESLNERVPVKFWVQDYDEVVKKAKLSLTKNFSFSYHYAGEKEIEALNEFVSNASNVFELRIALYLNVHNTEDLIIKMAETVTKLPNLKVVALSFFNSQVDFSQLRYALDILQNMEQLQELYLQKDDEMVNKQMIPQIQKSILRLVKFDQLKQIQVN